MSWLAIAPLAIVVVAVQETKERNFAVVLLRAERSCLASVAPCRRRSLEHWAARRTYSALASVAVDRLACALIVRGRIAASATTRGALPRRHPQWGLETPTAPGCMAGVVDYPRLLARTKCAAHTAAVRTEIFARTAAVVVNTTSGRANLSWASSCSGLRTCKTSAVTPPVLAMTLTCGGGSRRTWRVLPQPAKPASCRCSRLVMG